ncbi:hypothetical protein Tco_0652069 [Tanacetum coccineum]|uniref:Uncharacterized protein n=1 Tax=Tanacetum coccineum TaxID=301880 RepID=A0ABQ4WWS5_9ASTR
MLNHSKAEPIGLLKDVLCQVGVITIIEKVLFLDMPIDRDTPILVGRGFLYTCDSILNMIDRITSTFDGICHQTFRAAQTSLYTAESDSDDEEEYEIQRNKFGLPIYRPKPARYLNCSDSLDRSLALPEVLNPFKKICVWKKVVSFLGSLRVTLQHAEWKPDYTGCFNRKEDSDGQWHAQIRLTDPYGNIYDKGFTIRKHDDEAGSSRPKRSRQYETMEVVLLPQVYYEFLQWEGCNKDTKSRYNTKLAHLLPRINLCEAGTNEEIFTYVVWIGAFNINEPIYSELCHEFYSTYEFDEVYANDVLKTKKIIYDEHFNAQEYWLSISREENLSLSRSHAATIRNSVLRVLHKMITYGLCQRTTGYDKIQKNDLLLLSRVLSDEVIRSLSALIYCRDLDTTTLRELIDSEGRLIPKALRPNVPRVAIP